LPTLRSRSQTVRFGPLASDTLREILSRNGIEDAQQAAAIALAQGRADRALELARDGRAQQLVELALGIDDAVRGGKLGALLDLAEQLASSTDRTLTLETLALYYRDVAARAIDPGLPPRAFPEQAERIAERAAGLGPRAAAEHVSHILTTLENLERNANPETALDSMLLGLAWPTGAEPPRALRPGRSPR
jgi:hypothetical protein